MEDNDAIYAQPLGLRDDGGFVRPRHGFRHEPAVQRLAYFLVGAPLTIAATVGLLLWAKHDERKVLTSKTLAGEPQDE